MVDAAGHVAFPVFPTITTELWKKVQSIDPRIIQLSHVEGGLQYRTGWDASVNAIATVSAVWDTLLQEGMDAGAGSAGTTPSSQPMKRLKRTRRSTIARRKNT